LLLLLLLLLGQVVVTSLPGAADTVRRIDGVAKAEVNKLHEELLQLIVGVV